MTNAELFLNKFFKEKAHFNAALITSDSNRFYLTGVSSSDGIVLATHGKIYLIVDFRYYEMAKGKVKPPVEVTLAQGRFSDTIDELLKKHSIDAVWYEDFNLTVSQLDFYKKRFPGIRFNRLKGFIDNLRAIKSDEEIQLIKAAQKITDDAFLHILNYISKSRTERDVALELEFYMRSHGSEDVAFDTICVSGNKSSLPHGTPSDIPLSQNAFLTMDFGAKFNGYCADMTRTVVLGTANDEMKKVYSVVLEAQKRALEKIHAGVIGADVDWAARNFIYSEGYEGKFGHSTGHGLGIDVHETPSFSPSYMKKIPEGAVLSVEPGIYIEGKYGVRIEDIVVVTKNGYENLTNSPKNLLEL